MIPTRNRHALLAQCLQAIGANRGVADVEVIVVDDGSHPPIDEGIFPEGVNGKLLRLEGGGPAAARNAGIVEARSPIVLFTDDDTIPRSGWIEAAIEYLSCHPESVGVDGPVHSPSWDRLCEASLVSDSGHFWTCNVAYRRDCLKRAGMFRPEVFRFAHCEDRDLACRALAIGQMGASPEMVVVHTPRRIGLRDVVRQARWTRDALTFYALHPETTSGFGLPTRLARIWHSGHRWLHACIDTESAAGPERWARALTYWLVTKVVVSYTVMTTPSARTLRRRYLPVRTGMTDTRVD